MATPNVISIQSEEKLFTLADMRYCFIAGSTFENENISINTGDTEEEDSNALDFGDWMIDNFNIEVK